jgi:hypothetical protein
MPQDELLQAHAAMMELCTHIQARTQHVPCTSLPLPLITADP